MMMGQQSATTSSSTSTSAATSRAAVPTGARKPRQPGTTWRNAKPDRRKLILEKQRDINVDHDWWEYTYNDAIEMFGHLGYSDVEISFSGFWSQGDGAQFSGKWDPATCIPRLLKEALVDPADPLLPIATRFGVVLVTAQFQKIKLPTFRITTRGQYNHEFGTDFEFNWDDPDVGREQECGGFETDLTELSRDLMRYVYRQLEQEHEYQTSDEAVIEMLVGNEYRFDSTGAII